MAEPPRVLIVDDEPNIRLSLEFLMRKAGYAVRSAGDGEEALALVARETPDVVLLDLMMPKLDGFAVCARIRAMNLPRRVWIVIMTARGRGLERERARALGADDYIVKPFSTRDAVERVAALLASPPDVAAG
jgi:DNA-binding response OmpR family regulator